jgi:hypothetical protein
MHGQWLVGLHHLEFQGEHRGHGIGCRFIVKSDHHPGVVATDRGSTLDSELNSKGRPRHTWPCNYRVVQVTDQS